MLVTSRMGSRIDVTAKANQQGFNGGKGLTQTTERSVAAAAGERPGASALAAALGLVAQQLWVAHGQAAAKWTDRAERDGTLVFVEVRARCQRLAAA